MSDELPGTCCMCGGSSGIVYARAVDSHGIEAICKNCYPDKSPPQIARLIQENARLKDLLRWRDAETEKPESSGRYLVATDGSTDISEHIAYYSPLIGWSTKDAGIGWWRPIGPLPGE